MKMLEAFISNHKHLIHLHPVTDDVININEKQINFKFSDEYKTLQRKFGIIKVPVYNVTILGCTKSPTHKDGIVKLSDLAFNADEKLGAYLIPLYYKDNHTIFYNSMLKKVVLMNIDKDVYSFHSTKLSLEEIIIILLKHKITPPLKEVKKFIELIKLL